jgi:FkbM family methyltransferase
LATGRPIAAELNEVAPLDSELVFEASDSMVIDAIYWFGVQGYEGLLSSVWEELCRKSVNVLEIGANLGLFSCIGARSMQKGKYTAVEPLPAAASVLRKNLARNIPASPLLSVEIVEAAAVSDPSARVARINVPNDGRDIPVGSHLTEGVEIKDRKRRSEVEITAIPFCDLARDRDLIKIDAEGIEYELLAGAMGRLVEHRPTIVVEVLPEANRLAAFLGELASRCGYRITVVPAFGTGGLRQIEPVQFTSRTPQEYNSKDCVLSLDDLAIQGQAPGF